MRRAGEIERDRNKESETVMCGRKSERVINGRNRVGKNTPSVIVG